LTAVAGASRRVDHELLDYLPIKHTALLGLSLGTWMATHYAMARPDRVEGLAMLAPVGHCEPTTPQMACRDDL
jgi:pimeloyl-ACP methyl ester carboxylesterase